jgi:hypothetical protein
MFIGILGESPLTANRPKRRTHRDTSQSGEVTTHPNVVLAAERFLAPRTALLNVGPAQVVRPNFSARYRTPDAEPQRAFSPFFQNLQFVGIKGSGRHARVTSYWTDAPTEDGRADFKRGREHATRVIVAMNADADGACYLERIIEAIVIDAASRRAKGGKYSRKLPPAIQGFFYELSRQLPSRP